VLNANNTVAVTPPPPLPTLKKLGFTVEAEVTTTNATITTLGNYPIPTNSGFDISLVVYGIDTGNGNVKKMKREGFVKRLAGAPVLVGTMDTPTPDKNDAGAAAWAVAFSFTATNLLIQVTGAAGRTIDWSLFADVRQFRPSGVI
jgi:hypothetical protein